MKNALVFQRPNGGRIKVGRDALRTMRGYRQMSADAPEAGGILLGRFIVKSLDIVIDEVTVPTPADVCRRYFFKRDQSTHQQVVDQRWHDSGGTCHYLGEWHTHPEPSPEPSSYDLLEWERILRETMTDSGVLYFVIVGTRELRVWEGTRNTSISVIYPLKRIE